MFLIINNFSFQCFDFQSIIHKQCFVNKFFFDFQVDNDLKLVNEIRRNEIYINNFDANNEQDFNIKKIFQHLDKDVTFKVYINWFRFDNIDQMKFNDFSTYFYDIWFPSVDDIDLFDESYSWIVSIRHDGMIYVWNQ